MNLRGEGEMFSNKQRILIVDDNASIRYLLGSLLSDYFGSIIIEEAGCGQEFLQKQESFNPNLVLVDIVLPDFSGIEAVNKIKAKSALKIIFLSNIYDQLLLYKCYKVGGNAFIHKINLHNEMSNVLEHLNNDSTFYPKEISEINIITEEHTSQLYGFEFEYIRKKLTRQEYKIFLLLGEGNSRKDIVNNLFISPRTYDKHIEHIKNKLSVKSMSELFYLAVKHLHFKQQVNFYK